MSEFLRYDKYGIVKRRGKNLEYILRGENNTVLFQELSTFNNKIEMITPILSVSRKYNSLNERKILLPNSYVTEKLPSGKSRKEIINFNKVNFFRYYDLLEKEAMLLAENKIAIDNFGLLPLEDVVITSAAIKTSNMLGYKKCDTVEEAMKITKENLKQFLYYMLKNASGELSNVKKYEHVKKMFEKVNGEDVAEYLRSEMKIQDSLKGYMKIRKN